MKTIIRLVGLSVLLLSFMAMAMVSEASVTAIEGGKTSSDDCNKKSGKDREKCLKKHRSNSDDDDDSNGNSNSNNNANRNSNRNSNANSNGNSNNSNSNSRHGRRRGRGRDDNR